MALMITEDCINCGYCLMECPNGAIYEPGSRWSMGDATGLHGTHVLQDGRSVDADEWLPPLSNEYYFIVSEKCAECEGRYDHPQCMEVCPDPECIVVHPSYKESRAELLDKQFRLNFEPKA